MSETLSLANGGVGTIYGTYAEALAYLAGMYGDQYGTWMDLQEDERKQTLIAVARYLNRKSWIESLATFAARDAFLDDNAIAAFQLASYELAALAADDPTVLVFADQGTNIQNVNAGGAGVTFFNPTSVRIGSATSLPAIVMDLLGKYLSASASSGADGGGGQSGSSSNPFDHCHDFDRWRPF